VTQHREIQAMPTLKYFWISIGVSILIGAGCSSPNDGSTGMKPVMDTAGFGNTAVSPIPKDSNSTPDDTLMQARQDSPKKSLATSRSDQKRPGQKPPPSGWNLGAPYEIIPTLENNEKIPICKTAFARIRSEWSFDSKKRVFQIRGDSVSGLRDELPKMHDCLYCLPKSDIEKLFGKPSKVSGNEMLYFMDISCLGIGGLGTDGCEYLRVELAANKVAKRVSIVANAREQ
jgi:hypothetical protein